MPTPAEQKALAFAAIVIALGGAVRILRGGSPAVGPTAGEQLAMARHAAAANSAAVATAAARQGRGRGSRKVALMSDDSVAKTGRTGANTPLDARGFPPPYSRIDVGGPGPVAVAASDPRARDRPAVRPSDPVDLDLATEPQIQALPHIGPALARRIVANRDSAGPFGNLDALRRVRGVGPATLERLRPLVTFSGQTRR